jgi:hypothetical protein
MFKSPARVPCRRLLATINVTLGPQAAGLCLIGGGTWLAGAESVSRRRDGQNYTKEVGAA